MNLRDRLAWFRHTLSILLLVIAAAQLAGCGDKEPDQRKAFISFLQNTVLPGKGRLPALSDDQKQQFGPYAKDYQVLLTFNQQYTQSVNGSLQPVLDQIDQIRVPQDYLTHRGDLQQAAGALNLLAPQIDRLKKQADEARAALKQPDDLKAVYDQAYAKQVSQPAQSLTPLIQSAATLSDTLVHVGDFLTMQGNQVTFGSTSVSFPTQIQATQYNALMAGLQTQYQQLVQAKSAEGVALP